VEHGVLRPHIETRDEEPPPARVLAEREQRGGAVVGRTERREQIERVSLARGGRIHAAEHKLGRVELADDLRRIAEAAVVLAEPPEELAGIVPAEPAAGERLYLVAYRRDSEGEAEEDART